jgi:hypothetical protein
MDERTNATSRVALAVVSLLTDQRGVVGSGETALLEDFGNSLETVTDFSMVDGKITGM